MRLRELDRDSIVLDAFSAFSFYDSGLLFMGNRDCEYHVTVMESSCQTRLCERGSSVNGYQATTWLEQMACRWYRKISYSNPSVS